MDGERLRVAVFSDSAPPILNGVAVSIESLITELRDRGHSVHLFTSRFPRYKDPDPNTHRFPSLEFPFSRGYPIAAPPFIGMLRRFRQEEFDVVHTHTPFVLGFVGLRWAESHRLPVVSTYHTLYDRYAHYVPVLPRRYVRFRIARHTNFYYNRVDHVIAPTEAALKWLRRHSVDTPASVIPTGAPRRGFIERGEARHSLGVPPEARVMLYVGRLAKEKNLTALFEAAAIAFDKDPSLRLWLVGDGPYRPECAARVRELGIGDRVRFVGAVPRAEVDRYYAAADLFLFASVTETQGLVVQEAMAHGLPAVVAVGGGAGASVEEGVNGFLVKAEPRALATAALRVLGDDALHARLSEGAARSVRSHGVGEMTEGVLNVYRRVIREREERAGHGTLAWV